MIKLLKEYVSRNEKATDKRQDKSKVWTMSSADPKLWMAKLYIHLNKK